MTYAIDVATVAMAEARGRRKRGTAWLPWDPAQCPAACPGPPKHKHARATQLPPPGDWRWWLIMAGRRFGKTRTGAETISEWVRQGLSRRIMLVAPTAADVRDIMVEGESGLLAVARPGERPDYEPSKRKLTWPNGASAITRSAEDPDSIRGPGVDTAWCDEIASWVYPEAWDVLQPGLTFGWARGIATTTPKPRPFIRALITAPLTVITRGRTIDNAANLSGPALDDLLRQWEGTRTGRQELDGELLLDVPGALWQAEWIERSRRKVHPELARVVVAVDPATSSGDEADETAICAAGIGVDGEFYVLSCEGYHLSPHAWASKAVDLYDAEQADKIVAEVNNGGEMVISNIRAVRQGLPVRSITASRGKTLRAEPVSNLYEQNRVHHVGTLVALEEQMCLFPVANEHDDRVDALVYALTELSGGQSGVLGAMLMQLDEIRAAQIPSTAILCGERYNAGGAIDLCRLPQGHEGRHGA